MWERRVNPKCSAADVAAHGVACSQLVSKDGRCLTKVRASGAEIGLDAGTTYTVAQALPCKEIGDPSQTFDVVRGDQGGFPENFPVRSPASAGANELCLQPYIAKEPDFDAIAFQTPDGSVSVVAMNKGDDEQTFTLYDASLGLGAVDVVAPPHSIQSYKLPPKGSTAALSMVSSARLSSLSTSLLAEPSLEGHSTAMDAIGLLAVGLVGIYAAVSTRRWLTRGARGDATVGTEAHALAASDEGEQPYVGFSERR